MSSQGVPELRGALNGPPSIGQRSTVAAPGGGRRTRLFTSVRFLPKKADSNWIVAPLPPAGADCGGRNRSRWLPVRGYALDLRCAGRPSRPVPLCFTPPNGAAGSLTSPPVQGHHARLEDPQPAGRIPGEHLGDQAVPGADARPGSRRRFGSGCRVLLTAVRDRGDHAPGRRIGPVGPVGATVHFRRWTVRSAQRLRLRSIRQ